MTIDKNGGTYYLNGNTWFQPSYGANGDLLQGRADALKCGRGLARYHCLLLPTPG